VSQPRKKSLIKRRQILTAAENIFLAQGFEKTSMDLVAEQAEVSKPTVYSHFSSKEELFAAVVTSKCPSEAIPEEFFSIDTECRTNLLRIGRFAVEQLLAPEAIRVYRLCVDMAEKNPELSRRFFYSGPDRFIQRLMTYFEELTAREILQVDQPRLAASQLIMCFRGEAGLRMELNVPMEESMAMVDAQVARCVATFMAFYAGQAAGP